MDQNYYKAPESNLIEQDSRTEGHEFYVVSIRKFSILFFSTIGMYSIYWFYKNWRFYKDCHHLDIWPIPRGIFNIFFVHSLYGHIDDVLKERDIDYDWNPKALAVFYIIISLSSKVLDRLSRRNIGSPITDILGLAMIPLAYYMVLKAQKAINLCQGDPGGISNSAFTAANYFWIALGVCLWLIVAFGFIIMTGLLTIK